jgi:hypothetical protein
MCKTFICLNCSKEKIASPRTRGNQSYCGDAPCQRKRKSNWQKQKLKIDKDYRANQKAADGQWRKKRPSYWRDYRAKNAASRNRNRSLQILRNHRRRKSQLARRDAASVIAKMDVIREQDLQSFQDVNEFWLVPSSPPMIAKMDALKVKIVAVSAG